MTIPLGILLVMLGNVLTVVLLCWGVLALTRWRRAVQRRHEGKAERRVRPLVSRWVAGDDDVGTLLDGASAGDRIAMSSAAARLLPQMRGVDADRLIKLMEECTAREWRFGFHRRSLLGGRDRTDPAVIAAGGGTLEQLRLMLTDPDPELRSLAGYGLAARGHAPAAPLVLAQAGRGDGIPTATAADILARLCPGALPVLRGAASGPPSQRLLVAIMVLGQTRDAGAARPLAALAADERGDTEVRLRAAHALGRIGSPVGVAAVRACLVGPPELVSVAARARAELGGRDAVADLAPLLDSPDHAVAHGAAIGLARLGKAGESALRARVEGRASAHSDISHSGDHASWGRWEATRAPLPQASVLPLPGFVAMAGLAAFAAATAEQPDPSDGPS